MKKVSKIRSSIMNIKAVNMNIKAVKALAIVSCLIAVQLGYASGNGNKVVNICTGGYISGDCEVSGLNVNAAGDKVVFNTHGIPSQNLGAISTTMHEQIQLPASGKKIVIFTPIEGNLSYQQIKIFLFAFKLSAMPKGLPQSIYKEAATGHKLNPWANVMVKVYRQLPGETQWTEMMTSFTDEKTFKNLAPIKITLEPTAKATYYPPKHTDANGQIVTPGPIVFDLTKAL